MKSFINYKPDDLPDSIILNESIIGLANYNFYKVKKINKIIKKYSAKLLFGSRDQSGYSPLFFENLDRDKVYMTFYLVIADADNDLLGSFLTEISCMPNFIEYKMSKYNLQLSFYRNKKISSVASSVSMSTLEDQFEDFVLL